MANGIKVRMSPAGARALLSSPAMGALVGSKADAVRDAANAMASGDDMLNDPFESDVGVYGDRVRASVVTATPHGRRSNAKNSTLLRALSAGR